MITKMTGLLARVLDDEIRLAIGPIEYQVLVPDTVRRQLQFRIGTEITLHINEYIEGNQAGSRFVPRKLGFLTEQEVDFFELFCTVEKIGSKKALKAMARPVREIADAINRGDAGWLATLPGIGATTADMIITTLRKKMPQFLVARAEPELPKMMPDTAITVESEPAKKGKKKITPTPVEMPQLPPSNVVDDAYEMLLVMGMNPVEARAKIDALLSSREPFSTTDEALTLMFRTRK